MGQVAGQSAILQWDPRVDEGCCSIVVVHKERLWEAGKSMNLNGIVFSIYYIYGYIYSVRAFACFIICIVTMLDNI